MQEFSVNYNDNLHKINEALRIGENFDIIYKRLKVADRQATLYCIDGFVKDEMLEKTMEDQTNITKHEIDSANDADSFLDSYITYIESSTVPDIDSFITFVLSGAVGMIVEGFSKAIIIDCRTYPARDVQEPESDKVLRGSHEGFVETVRLCGKRVTFSGTYKKKNKKYKSDYEIFSGWYRVQNRYCVMLS